MATIRIQNIYFRDHLQLEERVDESGSRKQTCYFQLTEVNKQTNSSVNSVQDIWRSCKAWSNL